MINVSTFVTLAYYSPVEGYQDCHDLACQNKGEIILTRLDTIKCVVSGRFTFPCFCSDISFNPVSSDTILNITNGRFDIKLDVY
ncbi:hypothetical protein FACS189413_14810 [Bacteroidia bacterium]|nr:hypothetical protein FACS189463_0900 [Bacteroidia bacterium]GHU72156.1 hypothetical protein FACS189413_14810 [Bacteroidia bacterium]